ncbi:MAG: alpha/beta fold hydrolase [Terricaulis sp.]
MRYFAAMLALWLVLAWPATTRAAPLEAYGRLPAISDVEISADGAMLAYVTSRDRHQQVVVQRLDGEVLRLLDYEESKIRGVRWASPDHVLISRSVSSRAYGRTFNHEMVQMVSLNIRTGESVQLGDVIWGSLRTGVWAGRPVVYLTRHNIYRIDLETGVQRLHLSGRDTAYGYEVQADGVVLSRQRFDDIDKRWFLDLRTGDDWRTVQTIDASIEEPWASGLSQDGSSLIAYFWDDADEVWRPTPVSLETGQAGEPIGPPADIDTIFDWRHRMIGYARTTLFTEYVFFDPSYAETWRRVAESFPGRQVTLASFTPAFDKLVVYVEGTGFPGGYFLFDVAAAHLSLIARAYPDIPDDDIAEVRVLRYAAGDGLQIPAFLTLPRQLAPENLPLIVLPHGGPESRDVVGFDWMAQALASRGYAVLQPNFRGSEGYGHAFIEAGYGEWGRKMQTDLSDGVAYLAARGIIDPARVAIMGASYGGYAALAGVTLQTGIYRCAVSIGGVSDMSRFVDWHVLRYGRDSSQVRYLLRLLAIERPNDRSLRQISPVAMVENGSAPVLLIHGRDDTVVPYDNSTAMETALRHAGRPVRLVVLTEEDHWLSREATRAQTLSASVSFLEGCNPRDR